MVPVGQIVPATGAWRLGLGFGAGEGRLSENAFPLSPRLDERSLKKEIYQVILKSYEGYSPEFLYNIKLLSRTGEAELDMVLHGPETEDYCFFSHD